MSIFDLTTDNWRKTKENYQRWHRNDFIDALGLEMTGNGGKMGACGDFMPADANYKSFVTKAQLQRMQNGTLNNASRLQGIAISGAPPTAGQILAYDPVTKTYVPTSPSAASTGSNAQADVSTPQNITPLGQIFVQFGALQFDSGGYYNATHPERLTVSTAGVYMCIFNGTFSTSSTGDLHVQLLINGSGSSVFGGGTSVFPQDNGNLAFSITAIAPLTPGQYVVVDAINGSSTNTISITNGSFSIIKLS